MNSQNDKVLFLLRQGTIDSWDVIRGHGIWRLGARIYDLKQRGYNIEGFWSKIGNKSKYFYRLVS